MQAPLPLYLKDQLPKSLAPAREVALARFLKIGLPTRKAEDWRYTGLHELEKTVFRAASLPADYALPESFLGDAAAVRLVFVNGIYQPSGAKLPAGISIEQNAQDAPAIHSESWQELNQALAIGGMVLCAAKNSTNDKPIEILFLHVPEDADTSYHMRHEIHVEEGAALNLVEHHVSACEGAAAFITHNYNVTVAKGGRLNRTIIHASGAAESRLIHDEITLLSQAALDLSLIHQNGRLTRRSVKVNHEGTGATSTIRAITLADGKSHIDLLTDLRHSVAGTNSAQQIRSLASGTSHCVFQGKVLVAEGAQKTEAAQTHHGVLLSDTAEIDAKPMLEIYADDVKCSHGATCGALDETALFYLRSRGLPREAAEQLLLQAFMADAFETMPDKKVQEKILGFLSQEAGVPPC